MKSLLPFLFGQASASSTQERLAYDMLQAFYRREYGQIAHLAQKGARITHEMQCVAEKYKDPQLLVMCMQTGLAAGIRNIHVRRA